MSNPISPHQPNLNPKALIVFEKVAQHGSITKAAEDLNVAASSISRYIKILERQLGTHLFDRLSGKITLNENGRFFFNEVHQSLNRIRSSSWRVARKGSNHIKIWCYPVVASEWLLPRAERFYTKLNARVSVITGLIPPADTLQYCDVAILNEQSVLPDYRTSFLFTEKMVPVCTPSCMETGADENGRYSSLTISTTRIEELDAWNARHHNMLRARNELEFDHSAFAIAAARKGLGITLAADVWVANDLAAGDLVLPFGNRQVTGEDIYIAWGQNAGTPMVEIFTRWLTEEMQICQDELEKVYRGYAEQG